MLSEQRWQFTQFPTCVTDKFWNRADKSLNKYRTEFKTAAELQVAFTAIFDLDKETFREPDLVSHPQVAVWDVDDWLLRINSAAAAPASV
ncbi:hypothetical protein BT96DRAFT_1007417 [Gymnopus androsaceus JB14]|uniref:Uncharacterized protein n=1 Tax=Gymnopus androsaceus JB14 TaxID=1447944 RepID=A0A6A4GI89_9AGAR|nr:hypothetical protein BT96DRAFT_1007417 [Gymnopus androsaceus JB14]